MQSTEKDAWSRWTYWRTRENLSPDAIRQLAAIEAGAPIGKPLTRGQAIDIVTEHIGLFESVLRRCGGGQTVRRI
jgi:hypothetical protein